MTSVHTVLIETHGKQDYLFATGRRRESVGASQLVTDVAQWATADIAADWRISKQDEAECVIAGAGQFLGFFRDREHAARMIRTVTTRALREAPCLGVTGVIGAGFDWNSGQAPTMVREAFAQMERVRVEVASPATRFPMLPVTEPCPSSGLPAARLVKFGTDFELRSEVSAAKLDAAVRGLTRLATTAGLTSLHATLRRLDGDDPNTPERIAVVHADGNGLGEVVQKLGPLLAQDRPDAPDDAYADGYRRFSQELDDASRVAFRDAVESLDDGGDILPLVFGGDDLTFVADATVAPQLCRRYLSAFIRAVAARPAIGPILARLNDGDPRLGVSAGMVIVGPHFPFSAAYTLAEGMTKIAKQAKTNCLDTNGHPIPCASMAMHVHLDSPQASVEGITASLSVGDRRLTANPYVEIVDPSAGREPSAEAAEWLTGRALDGLWSLARDMTATNEEGRRIRPAAQLHEIRSRLRPDPTAAERYLARLAAADPARWSAVGELFSGDSTQLLDAMALSPYLGGEGV